MINKKLPNTQKMFQLGALALATSLLAACSEDLGELTGYDIENSCQVFPDLVDDDVEPVYTNGPVTDAVSLMSSIRLNYSSRLNGAMPGPATGSGLNFSNLVITDKSIQELFVNGSVPDGRRIGALFLGIDGTNEYLAVPIPLGSPSGSATGDGPVQVTLKGPFPIEGTDPEPDIIVNDILGDLTVKAFLVDESEEAPDVSGPIDGADDAANWLLPAEELTISATNVGTGSFTSTLFWNSATDVDLWVIEPDGNRIYYGATNSIAGDGFLDIDNRDGYGPENVFFTENIPDGRYQVVVHYYSVNSHTGPTNWSVSVTACGSTRAFSGTLNTEKEQQGVFSFTHGENCSIEPPPPTFKDPSIFEEAVLCDPATLEELEN